MDRKKLNDGFDFYDYQSIHYDVWPEPHIEPNTIMYYGDRRLPGDLKIQFFQLVTEKRLIGRFQQSDAQTIVHAYRGTDDRVSQWVFLM